VSERPLRLWLVVAGLLVTWWSRFPLSARGLLVIRDRPLVDPFFPAWLQRFDVACAAYLVPGTLGVLALHPRLRAQGLALFALGAGVLLVHQAAYNDASFVTALWTSLIGLWLWRREQRGGVPPEQAAAMTQLFVGVLFLGGLVGKLTPGYLDGSVFFDIYFRDRDYLPFRLARSWLEPGALRSAATVYSRFVLGVELSLATLPLWPARLGLGFAVLGLCGLTLLSNPYLISVVAGPLSLCVLCLGALRAPSR
jgi:hypothetical protein